MSRPGHRPRIAAGRAALRAAFTCLVVTTLPSRADEPAADSGDGATATWAPVVKPAMPAFDARRARALYDDLCRVCHGTHGRGDGAIARYLEPRPRDLTRGVYKFRSTPSGALPTERDLFDTITRGLPGTTMTSFGGLSTDDRWQLVLLVESMSPRFAAEPATESLVIPPAPPASAESVARGRAAWVKSQCSKCHGDDGRGWGPAARTQRDDLGRVIYPFNLARGDDYRAGRAPQDLYRTLQTGLDGTPMPSYGDSLTAAETWDLVHYVRSLNTDGRTP